MLKQRRDAEAEAAAATTPTEDQALLVRDYSPSPADAAVTLVEFFDPSCRGLPCIPPRGAGKSGGSSRRRS